LKIHIIKKGETLAAIAAQYNIDLEALKRSNQQVIDPSMIVPGMKLTIPQQSKNIPYKDERSHHHKQFLKNDSHEHSPKEPTNYMQPRRPMGEDENIYDRIFAKQNTNKQNENKDFARHDKEETQLYTEIYCDCCNRKMYFT